MFLFAFFAPIVALFLDYPNDPRFHGSKTRAQSLASTPAITTSPTSTSVEEVASEGQSISVSTAATSPTSTSVDTTSLEFPSRDPLYLSKSAQMPDAAETPEVMDLFVPIMDWEDQKDNPYLEKFYLETYHNELGNFSLEVLQNVANFYNDVEQEVLKIIEDDPGLAGLKKKIKPPPRDRLDILKSLSANEGDYLKNQQLYQQEEEHLGSYCEAYEDFKLLIKLPWTLSEKYYWGVVQTTWWAMKVHARNSDDEGDCSGHKKIGFEKIQDGENQIDEV